MEPQNQDLTTFDLLLYVPFDLSDVLPVSFQSLSLAFFLHKRALADPLVDSFPLDRSHDLRLLINTCPPPLTLYTPYPRRHSYQPRLPKLPHSVENWRSFPSLHSQPDPTPFVNNITR